MLVSFGLSGGVSAGILGSEGFAVGRGSSSARAGEPVVTSAATERAAAQMRARRVTWGRSVAAAAWDASYQVCRWPETARAGLSGVEYTSCLPCSPVDGW